MPILPREVLNGLDLPVHGGLDYAELATFGLQPEDIVDFSANLNPWGASPRVVEAIARAAISRYPDTESTALRRAIADRIGTTEDNVIAGNGSSELLWLIGSAFLDAADRVLIVGPTFGEYERVARMAGAEVAFHRARECDDFCCKTRPLAQLVAQWRPKIVFLCNPNNPTGSYLDRNAIEGLLESAADSLVVLDEAYVGFVGHPWSSVDLIDRGVLVLRSMTKDHGLAGLRLGYAMGDVSTIAALRKVRQPWNVNAVAQAAGLACLEDEAHVVSARQRLSETKEYLISELGKLNLRAIPSATSFFLLEVGDAEEFRAQLLRRGLLVRDCRSFGLPRFVRVAARTRSECERLISAIATLRPTGRVTD